MSERDPIPESNPKTMREQLIAVVWATVSPSTDGHARYACEKWVKAIRMMPYGMFADEVKCPPHKSASRKPS